MLGECSAYGVKHTAYGSSILCRDSRGEDDDRRDDSEGRVQRQRYNNGFSDTVEGVWIEGGRAQTDIHAYAREDRGEQKWSGTKARFEVQEQRASKEEEDRKDDSRSRLDVLSAVDCVNGGVEICVRACEICAKNT